MVYVVYGRPSKTLYIGLVSIRTLDRFKNNTMQFCARGHHDLCVLLKTKPRYVRHFVLKLTLLASIIEQLIQPLMQCGRGHIFCRLDVFEDLKGD